METERKNTIIQKELNPPSGFLMLVLIIVGLIASVCLMVFGIALIAGYNAPVGLPVMVLGIILLILFCISFGGLKVVGPNEALVLTLFGNYYGTILKPGFFFVNPFSTANNPNYKNPLVEDAAENVANALSGNSKEAGKGIVLSSRAKKTISLKDMTLSNGVQKVNDVMGNPVIISANVIWKVEDPTKAVFNVENYTEFLSIQADSAIRHIARLYPYDIYDDTPEDDSDNDVNEKTLRGSSMEIAENMKQELAKRVEFAGLMIEEVRLTHIAYSEEIAAAMLQRQQASAIIAARRKIVDGAVSMVKMAIDKLNEDDICILDEERKAQMVSNLLVVLCSGKDAQPVVNSGSIYG